MISDFLEADLIPLFLKSDLTASAILCDFFTDASRLLERIEPKTFPRKSLNFAETFNRAINTLRLNSRTPDQYVCMLRILRNMGFLGIENREKDKKKIAKKGRAGSKERIFLNQISKLKLKNLVIFGFEPERVFETTKIFILFAFLLKI